jgi:hypothetical protein
MAQQIISYLYPNRILVQISDDITVTQRNPIVYAKNIRIYQGVSNTLQILFRNADQKPVSVSQQHPSFVLLRDTDASIYIKKPITVTDPVRGIGTVTIQDSEILDLAPGFYGYSITVQNELGSESVTYVDDNYGARGVLEVISGAYPEFAESQVITLQENLDITNSADAGSSQNQNSALHTLSMYFQNFTGTITVQGTQDPVPSSGPSANYADILTQSYTNQSVPDYVNFQGVFQAIRLQVTTESGEFEKALYRN